MASIFTSRSSCASTSVKATLAAVFRPEFEGAAAVAGAGAGAGAASPLWVVPVEWAGPA